jgi:hypothetical protein
VPREENLRETKRVYEPPRVIDLGEVAKAMTFCPGGPGDFEGCGGGNGAAGACGGGGGATPST